ncbi:MAG: hypothetical protein WEB56_06440, partial [Roseovarius sp.]
LDLATIRQFARVMKRYSGRVASGLPSDCLWLKSLELKGPRKRLSRQQMISLKDHGIARPHLLMDGSQNLDHKRQIATPHQSGVNFPNLVRDAAKEWKFNERKHFKAKHEKSGVRHDCLGLVNAVYTTRGKALETAVLNLIEALGIPCEVLDDGNNPAWPDLKFNFSNLGLGPDVIVEVKSKESENALVSLNDAIEVLSASELVGLGGNPCLTICNPGVEPSVQTAVAGCSRLAILEVSELAEAFLRIKDGNLDLSNFYGWLVTPGVALKDDLPFANN